MKTVYAEKAARIAELYTKRAETMTTLAEIETAIETTFVTASSTMMSSKGGGRGTGLRKGTAASKADTWLRANGPATLEEIAHGIGCTRKGRSALTQALNKFARARRYFTKSGNGVTAIYNAK